MSGLVIAECMEETEDSGTNDGRSSCPAEWNHVEDALEEVPYLRYTAMVEGVDGYDEFRGCVEACMLISTKLQSIH